MLDRTLDGRGPHPLFFIIPVEGLETVNKSVMECCGVGGQLFVVDLQILMRTPKIEYQT